jgi:hypothetical protein
MSDIYGLIQRLETFNAWRNTKMGADNLSF